MKTRCFRLRDSIHYRARVAQCSNCSGKIGVGEMGSGNMKAAFQCVGWKKKGSCFHELRRSRYPQEVQRGVRAG